MTGVSDLEALRSAIDEIDEGILEMFARRVTLVMHVAEYKRQHSLEVYDPERERQVIERLMNLAPPNLERQSIRRVFERIIDESRRIEQRANARG